jgi:SAM-dependent methyltransferase
MKESTRFLIKKIVNKIPPLYIGLNFIRSQYRKLRFGYRIDPIVEGRIHFNDKSLVNNDYHHYNQVGDSAIMNINLALKSAELTSSQIHTLLDFPCGYGRVLRKLKKHFPKSTIDVCDIVPEAVKFCAREFHSNPIFSKADFSLVQFPKTYNLIWIGSLITHLDLSMTQSLLEKVCHILKNKGLVVFTAHGKHSVERMDTYQIGNIDKEMVQEELNTTGYFYIPYAGKNNYGISICNKEFMTRMIGEKFKNKLNFIYYSDRGWDNHQDVYAFQKI